MTNPEHVKVIKNGCVAIQAWLERNAEIGLDCTAADLSGIDLRGCDLRKVIFSEATLSGAQLFGHPRQYRISASNSD
jgi:uncharacterized protein YjbI with pentapeptide repeats